MRQKKTKLIPALYFIICIFEIWQSLFQLLPLKQLRIKSVQAALKFENALFNEINKRLSNTMGCSIFVRDYLRRSPHPLAIGP